MSTLSRRSYVVAFAATALAAGLVVGFEFSGLLAAAILVSGLATQSSTEDRATMAPSFVMDFTALLLFGPAAAMLVAMAGAITQGLADSHRSNPRHRMLVNAVIVVVATQVAWLLHHALRGTLGHFIWPWQGVPIAAAVVGYCVVKSASADIIVPLVTRRPVSWFLPSFLSRCPSYFVGASLAVGLVELIDHQKWDLLIVAALPLYSAYQVYAAYVNRLGDEHRRSDVVNALEQGMCVVASSGTVTLWNDALERIVGCPGRRAIGRSLVAAVPALSKSDLPRAINLALTSRRPGMLANVALPSAAGARTVQVKIVPGSDGVTLLWQDVTDRTSTETALKRSEDRFALAAAGANDGLWEWDLQTHEVYFSGRWRAMLGLPASAGIGRPDEWIERVHPDDLVALKDALAAHLSGKTEHVQHEHRIRHADGTYRRFLCRGVAVRAAGRRAARIAGSLTDRTEHATAQEQHVGAAFLDPLTGLCNRAVFVEGLGRRLDEFKQHRGGPRFAVLYLDLDRFKVVNDSLGHLVGDELLTAVSRRLEACLRQGDTLARLGGDEFAILLNGLGDEQQANAVAFRIQETLSAPFSIGGREVFTSASIGIAFGLSQYSNPDEIMRDADTAMYHAKSRGKARHELFDADMDARARDRLGLENDLRHAVNSNDFEVHYQPIVSLATGRCVGFESLVRWTRHGESISPVTFIPIAEELGLIESIGTWVMQQACITFADWQRRFPDVGLDFITVNVSSRQLTQQNFRSVVEKAVHAAGLKPCDLRLEITETALMDTPHVVALVLRELRDFGVKIYLDDFGTGYSSLSHLHKLPVDALKIDRSFVRSLVFPDRPAIVESILALARTLNTSVVAEGIESEVQARELERLGCTHAQGFLFSRPVSARAAEELLIANQPLGPKQIHPSDRVAAAASEPVFYPSGPFEWPEEVAPRVAAERSAPRVLDGLTDIPRT
jgi:diguanylate cyclase (GGDEF)-like protein/PAS domain S-box-containing protein